MATDESSRNAGVSAVFELFKEYLNRSGASYITMYYRKKEMAKAKVTFDSESQQMRVLMDDEQKEWLRESAEAATKLINFEEYLTQLEARIKEDGNISLNALCSNYWVPVWSGRGKPNTNVNVDVFFKVEDLRAMDIPQLQQALDHFAATASSRKNTNFINPQDLAVKLEGGDLSEEEGEEAEEAMDIKSQLKAMIESGVKQIVLTGAPGTGKTFTAQKVAAELITGDPNAKVEQLENNERYEFVQFHSSYDYTDFVEGLRPYKASGTGDSGIGFRLEDGIFRRFCSRAREKSDNYYFIIDEINRADLSKVFGELMFGLEESYRGKEFNTQYSSLRQSMKAAGEDVEVKFSIPKNVIIIGTMNDIDRSVEAFDFALRRRFVWREVKANEGMENAVLEMFVENENKMEEEDKLSLIESAKRLNDIISSEGSSFGLNDHYHIGPSYFGSTKLEDLAAAKQEIWDYRVMFILQEYVRGYDMRKVQAFMSSCREAFLGVPAQA